MNESLKLYMLLLGCTPKGRNTEQHDTFFCIGNSLKSIIPEIIAFWPDAGTIHIDAWREVTMVNGFNVTIIHRETLSPEKTAAQLYFLNLGGYKRGEFEEYHYKMLAVATDKKNAIAASKKTAFYKHTGFKGAESHIDDKFGVDVDDIHEIRDILPKNIKEKYSLQLKNNNSSQEDEWHLGYTILSKITNQ